MDFYVIPPLAHLELMHQGNRYFCLAQLYKKSPEYREFFRQVRRDGGWITLDNGAGDHDIVTLQDLFNIVMDLHPSEVIPPDYLFDASKTLAVLTEFLCIYYASGEYPNTQLFACPQGATKEEWLTCYKTMLQIPQVNTIGFSKIAIPYAFLGKTGDIGIAEARNLAYDTLKSLDLLQKPIHCLGMGSPKEFDHYKGDSLIRSTDSCNTVWSAMNDISFSRNEFDRIPTPKDYFDRTISKDQLVVAQSNIDWFKGRLKENDYLHL